MKHMRTKIFTGVATCLLLLTACNENVVQAPTAPTPTTSSNVQPLPPVTVEPLPPVTTPPSIEPLPPATETPSYNPVTPSETTTPSPTPSKTAPTTPPPAMKKTVALTFDDGPGAQTLEVLAILKEKNVVATFYETGTQVVRYPSISRQLSEAGMSVQSHSWRHADLTTLSNGALRTDLQKANSAIEDAIGKAPTCVRPPYGATSQRVNGVISESVGSVSLWNVDSRDWTKPGSDKIYQQILTTLTPQSTILMHDGVEGREQTVAMLPSIIDALKEKGYTFVFACKP